MGGGGVNPGHKIGGTCKRMGEMRNTKKKQL
jgi:hypothetical protein